LLLNVVLSSSVAFELLLLTFLATLLWWCFDLPRAPIVSYLTLFGLGQQYSVMPLDFVECTVNQISRGPSRKFWILHSRVLASCPVQSPESRLPVDDKNVRSTVVQLQCRSYYFVTNISTDIKHDFSTQYSLMSNNYKNIAASFPDWTKEANSKILKTKI